MIAELGHFALALALAVAVAQAAMPFALKRNAHAAHMTLMAAHAQLALVAFAFAALVYLFVVTDLSVRVVAANSHSDVPPLYRVAGVWSNHEGSMVLWMLLLSACGSLHAATRRPLDELLKRRALGIEGLIAAAFLAFILFTSDPFARLAPAPLQGSDINPILQDPGLALHPPLLYLGYVGFAVTFALAIAGLIGNRIDAAWGRAVRPWALASWIALTLGIALGSYWAYYELGWGGFWFWDPVENASLLPWLAGTALLHSAIVVERREALRGWTVLLAILAFAMSLLGTFLVRSGVLTSVHAFASNPERGIFVLAIFVGFVGFALALYAWRAPSLAPGGTYKPISREGAIVLNSLLLSSAAAAVLMGTLYPMALEALTGDLVSVGPPYFNLVCGVLVAPLLLTLPLGPLAAWKRADLARVLAKLWVAALAALGVTVLAVAFTRGAHIAPMLLLGAGAWLIGGALTDLADRAGALRSGVTDLLARARGLPSSAYGTALAHAGLGIVLLGIAVSSAFKSEALKVVEPGGKFRLGQIEVRLLSVTPVQGANYVADRAEFRVTSGRDVANARSEKRRYWTRRVETTEVGLVRHGFSHVYLALGDARPSASGQGTAWSVHAFHQPLVLLIWTGAALMAVGGMLALMDRRLRLAIIRKRTVEPAGARRAQQAG